MAHRKGLLVRMPPELHEALKASSHFLRVPMNELAVEAIRSWCADEGRQREFSAILEQAQEDYGQALEKLARL